MRTALRILIVLVVLGAAITGVAYWRTRGIDQDSTTLVLYGNIDVRQVELAINGNERIGQVLVEEGDHVKKGQLLAQLELERFELAVDRVNAQIATQQQVVARLEAGSRPEEIAKAMADYTAAEAVVADADKTYQRNLGLASQNAISQQVLDDSKAALDTARARASAAKATFDLVFAGPRQEDIAEAKAVLGRLQVELSQAQHELADAHLNAPADGIIQGRILEVGDMATPQKSVYTLALVDPVWVRAYVAEPDLGKVFEGMRVKVMTDSFPNKEYDAWVGFISPTAEFTPKPVETRELRTKLVYQMRVFVKNPNRELRLGMPATIRIDLRQDRPQPAGQDGT